MNPMQLEGVFYRVWIGRYSRWCPSRWSDVPPQAEAVEPVDSRILGRDEARQVVEGFNRRMLHGEDCRWAIAVPVRIRIDGEPRPGQTFRCVERRNVTRGFSNRPSVRDKR